MRLLSMLLVACSTSNPVASCDWFPESDCCATHDECAEFYGSEYGYCSRPDRAHGGVCAECAEDRHCDPGETCDTSDDGFGVCVEP